ncbi:hypothetical protein [Algoriphagus hitonicola]|uniref:Uncharacterized protein n=1 Tax=Algoriphagus hitonicola TaxID=435880 RepID=A0A1I2PF65_9BACT|nr:hypothetical protein [Algoriphagus hitonicola]SFG14160.1 hypothetical protein SAMN04487988_101551 [Algoriphagus hitonicola]
MKQTLFIIFIGLTSFVHAQSIDIGDIKINGIIGYSLTLDKLRSSNLEIDSIKPIPELMDMSMADSLVYIGRTYFEYFANSNKCILSVIQFDCKISEVRIGSLTLSNLTTIESIQDNFPEDCQSTSSIEIYQDPKTYRTCGVPISANGQLTDSRLLFFFLEGKLTRIDIWEPS